MSILPASENPKSAIRKEARARRSRLPIAEISQAVRFHLQQSSLFRQAKQVLLYVPFRDEIDILPLCLSDSPVHYYLPAVHPDNAMHFYAYRPGDILTPGEYGILEPERAQPLDWQTLSATDIILTPGLAFDTDGYRLGYGKGYYDRFFDALKAADCLPVTIGVSAEALLFERLPRDDWDIPLNVLVTEQGIRHIPSNE